MIKLYEGDCLDIMLTLPDKSIDMILCDLPYGITNCKWDFVIPFEKLWPEYKRLIKDNGAIVLFGSEPFSSYLRLSNIEMYKYDWIWEKQQGTNPLLSKKQPLRVYENIIVFYRKQSTYIPKMSIGRPYKGFNSSTKLIGDASGGAKSIHRDNIIGDRYPVNILKFNTERSSLHPTQKPTPLLEYLIKTYSNENETILDNTMGSGSTGVACVNTNRNFIGIEKDPNYFKVAEKRIQETESMKFNSIL